jgi:hypothetical protein
LNHIINNAQKLKFGWILRVVNNFLKN